MTKATPSIPDTDAAIAPRAMMIVTRHDIAWAHFTGFALYRIGDFAVTAKWLAGEADTDVLWDRGKPLTEREATRFGLEWPTQMQYIKLADQ